MARLDINKMLKKAPDIPEQRRKAVTNLAEEILAEQSAMPTEDQELEALGEAYRLFQGWQANFEWAAQMETPVRKGLAGLRIIPDYTVAADRIEDFFPRSSRTGDSHPCEADGSCEGYWGSPILTVEDAKFFYKLTKIEREAFCPDPDERAKRIKESEDLLVEHLSKPIKTVEDAWLACDLYLERGLKFNSGKLRLSPGSPAEAHFLTQLSNPDTGCIKHLGGQAGQILWLWYHLGSNPYAHAPYGLGSLVDLLQEQMPDLHVLRIEGDACTADRLGNMTAPSRLSVFADSDPHTQYASPPTGGSVVFHKAGERVLFGFKGFRVLESGPDPRDLWSTVRFLAPDGATLVELTDPSDPTWPIIPLFAECYIREEKLVIRICGAEELRSALRGRVDCAILGGLDALFHSDGWIAKDKRGQLRSRLRKLLVDQLKAMAGCGVRIGIELSGYPSEAYALLLRELCGREIVVALGINGEDELPKTVGSEALMKGLDGLWLDPEADLQGLSEGVDAQEPDEVKTAKSEREYHFEYVTYLRARQLAEFAGVRTLYVHTNCLDFILRRDADPGALLHAQLADMAGKGFVIAALLRRAYGPRLWHTQKVTPAVSPAALVSLARFAHDYQTVQEQPGSADCLLQHGYWQPIPGLERSVDTPYSVAVVPVMWPAVHALPAELNTTGAGDMTFGAFFFLGGV